MSNLDYAMQNLKLKNKKAIIPYIMAGDGGLDCLNNRLLLLEKMGATAIEIGIPFSDPVADGPTIQSASIRALNNNVTLKHILFELKKVKSLLTVPIILMTYMNPIYAYGINKFVKDIADVGVAGCIIPDLPIEEEDIIAPLLEETDINLIRLVTMTTPLERIKTISERGNGFLYAVTIKGITGTRSEFGNEIESFLNSVKSVSSKPIFAGFGVSNIDQIIYLNSLCDGVIIGSKIIELFETNDIETMENLFIDE
ncbi:MAG: tryptophan synthase subunit alpha [Bacillales bacterium]|jgi:tryptophan synthase alpha chain|nr:tryptophan synthase subunit alpha [Bacillales bacterium]